MVQLASSSDANYPVSLGIPSLDIGGGGRGTDAHAPGEAFDTTDSWMGTERALLLCYRQRRWYLEGIYE